MRLKRAVITDYLKKGTSINSAQYIEILKKLMQRVCHIRESTKTILFQHDNTHPHTSIATTTALKQLKFD